MLDDRARLLLKALVERYIADGQPVGSRTLSKASGLELSPATIRNVMSDLEDLGFLEQPHTSAGRVPTDQGYRFYVDNLLGVLSVSDSDLRMITDQFGLPDGEMNETPDHLMQRTSQLLSALSNNIGIVVSPGLADDRLQHIEFINLSEKRILVVLVSAPNIVHNKIIRLRDTFPQDDLDRTARYLNKEFGGKSLSQIRTEIMKLMHAEKALFDKLLQTAMILCSQSIESEDDKLGEIYVDGTPNILTKSDFADLEKLRELLRTIGEKSRLMNILNECVTRDHSVKGDVQVVIGSENSASSLQNCTLITAPYRIGNSSTVGTLSVLGPTRIEYARMISIVGYVARIVEKMIANELAEK